jgi:imidazolonepropionase-like amidohydrolase
MRRLGLLSVSVLVPVLLALSPAGADGPADATRAFKGARILTAAGDPIDDGILVIRGTKIVAVGRPADVPVPDGAAVVDVTGKTIIPGLVDTHSHLGVYPRPHVLANSDGNEGSGSVQPGIRALDSVQPDDPGIRMALAGGVTTANIMPGSANVIGGQTVYVKLRGRTVEDMHIVPGDVLGGLKMANGENPKRFHFEGRKAAPGTRMKVAALQREQFAKARDYQRQWAAYRKKKEEDKEAAPPDTDLSLEPLVEVLERKRTVHFHSHRADDLMTAVRLSEEFGFELVLQHVTEGYRVADELARRKIPASLTLIDSPGGKPEVAGLLEENAAILNKAGVLVAINTDDSITESRFFLRSGAQAVRGGMPEDAVLRAQTINPAKMMHLDGRLGSLTAGKDADFVVLSGAPYSVYTKVLETYIDGVKVFDRSQPLDWSYQTGGFALADRSRLPQPAGLIRPLPAVERAAPEARFKEFRDAPKRYVVHAARIHTVSHGTIEDGLILVEDGKIKAIGPRARVEVPAGLPALTAAVVTPGLIDAHSVVGLAGALNVTADQDQDELSDPNQADLRALDGFNPREGLLEFLRSQGVTVIHAVPGPANVIAGQTGIFRTAGITAEGMALRTPAGILINLGEVPKSSYPGKLPTTRMATAALVRTALAQARDYQRKKATAKEDKAPPVNPKLEALALALERKVPVIFAAHRADDIDTALRLAKEFNLKVRLDMATEGYLIADRLAAAGVPVVVHPPMQRAGGTIETYNTQLGNAAILADHKIPLAIGTGYEGYVPKTRVLRYEAALAMVNGLGYERTLSAITLDAAKILGIDKDYGSLEPGKVADLVLFDNEPGNPSLPADPFEYTSHVSKTIMAGRVVYDRSEYLKLPYARRALPLISDGGGVGCCLGLW